jgi:hypothetical protein
LSKGTKKKPEHQKVPSLLESLKNPKSKYEQESKENKQSKAPVKIQNQTILTKLTGNKEALLLNKKKNRR